jgi:molecular chaperone GrpE
MVNKKHENEHIEDSDIEITNEKLDINDDVEVGEAEEHQADTIKQLRTKLKEAEADKRAALEDLQRTKADFLNARRRLEEERLRDRERGTISHIEDLIPLCDSFEMAMSNKEAWEKIDAVWRKGVEGIYAQLGSILSSNKVEAISPLGEHFDPTKHEALSTTLVTKAEENDTIVNVIQKGYLLKKADGNTEMIRPARVIIGHFEN